MLMDLPTVFFWNENTRYLLDDHADFFASLQRVGICQPDPIAAARFVESIKDDPARWWHRADTRAARDEFIAANFGQPSVLVERLLRLSASA
jgi:putative transferase (TIGR04331 family)